MAEGYEVEVRPMLDGPCVGEWREVAKGHSEVWLWHDELDRYFRYVRAPGGFRFANQAMSMERMARWLLDTDQEPILHLEEETPRARRVTEQET